MEAVLKNGGGMLQQRWQCLVVTVDGVFDGDDFHFSFAGNLLGGTQFI